MSRVFIQGFQPPLPSELTEAILAFRIQNTRITVPRDLLLSVPSSLSAAITKFTGSGARRLLQDAINLVQEINPDLRTFNVVFHMLTYGTSARNIMTTATQQVKYGNSTEQVTPATLSAYHPVTLDFGTHTSSIVLAAALEADPVVDFLCEELSDEFSTVALTYDQCKTLFHSENVRLLRFLVKWLFEFARDGYRYDVCEGVAKQALEIPGFPEFIGREMDKMELDEMSEPAKSVLFYIYGQLPDEVLRREMSDEASKGEIQMASALNTQKKAKKRTATDSFQKDKGKRARVSKTVARVTRSSATTAANDLYLVRSELADDADSEPSNLHTSEEPNLSQEVDSSILNDASGAQEEMDAVQSVSAAAQKPRKRKVITLKFNNPARLAALGKAPAPTQAPSDALTPLTTAIPTTSYTPADRARDPNNLKIGAKSKPGEHLYPQGELDSAADPNSKADEKSKKSKKSAVEAPPAGAAPKTKIAPRTKKAAVPPAAPTRVQPARERKEPAKYRK